MKINVNLKFETEPSLKSKNARNYSERSPTIQSSPILNINWTFLIVIALIGAIGCTNYSKNKKTIVSMINNYKPVQEWIVKIISLKANFLNLSKNETLKQQNQENLLELLDIGAKQPQRGEYVGGYPITSQRGYRIDPVIGTKNSWHNGVDSGTPERTPIYAVADGIVTCKYQKNGAGYYAELIFANNNWQIRYFHLSAGSCQKGKVKAGGMIAKSGNSGKSTGSHLHTELRKRVKNEWEGIDPSTAIIKYSLKPIVVFVNQSSNGNRVALKNINSNVAAFLDTIAWAEGTLSNDGYQTLYTGRKFSDLSKHPNIVICAKSNSKKICSSAAGRYQFLPKTYAEFKLDDFTPKNQDRAAIALLKQINALEDIQKGRIALAIQKAGKRWASFPGNNWNQPKKNTNELVKRYNERLRIYQKH